MPRRPLRRDRGPAGRVNMTPMIDVTFLLLTFFMLASHFASVETTQLDLPQPDDSQAIERRLPDKVIINVTYDESSGEPGWRIGARPVASLAELSDRLRRLADVNPRTQVMLRADRRLAYGRVREVMEVIAEAGLGHLQVIAEVNDAR